MTKRGDNGVFGRTLTCALPPLSPEGHGKLVGGDVRQYAFAYCVFAMAWSHPRYGLSRRQRMDCSGSRCGGLVGLAGSPDQSVTERGKSPVAPVAGPVIVGAGIVNARYVV